MLFHEIRSGTLKYIFSGKIENGKIVGSIGSYPINLTLYKSGNRLELRGNSDLSEYYETFTLQKVK